MHKQIMRHMNQHIQRMNETWMTCNRAGCLAFDFLTHKFCVQKRSQYKQTKHDAKMIEIRPELTLLRSWGDAALNRVSPPSEPWVT